MPTCIHTYIFTYMLWTVYGSFVFADSLYAFTYVLLRAAARFHTLASVIFLFLFLLYIYIFSIYLLQRTSYSIAKVLSKHLTRRKGKAKALIPGFCDPSITAS